MTDHAPEAPMADDMNGMGTSVAPRGGRTGREGDGGASTDGESSVGEPSDGASEVPPSAPGGRGVRGFAGRLSGVLFAPRRVLLALTEAETRRDGLWLMVAWLLGTKLPVLGDGLATFLALSGRSSWLALGNALGRALLVPVLTLVAVEAIAGARGHLRGLLLAPLVVIAIAAHAIGPGGILGLAGVAAYPTWPWADALGIVWALGLAVWLRGQPPTTSPAIPQATSSPPTAITQPSLGTVVGLPARIVSVGLTAMVVSSAVVDARRIANTWETLAPLGVDETIPKFSVRDLSGGRLASADLRGKVTLLVFWATWCGACSRQMPSYVDLHHAIDDEDFQLIAVNTDHDADQAALARAYVDERNLPFKVVLDTGVMARGFRANLLPHMVVVDRDGRIRAVHQGITGPSVLERKLRGFLAETP